MLKVQENKNAIISVKGINTEQVWKGINCVSWYATKMGAKGVGKAGKG